MLAWKWSDWRNWRLYYPTILYYIVGDLLYGLLLYNYPLWERDSPLLKTTFSDILMTFVAYPAVILIYLSNFPKGLKKQIFYVLLQVVIYTSIEYVALLLGYFSYHNGWTIWWSLILNCEMYPMLWLHYKKPLWAMVGLLVCTMIGMIYFKVPISSMK